MEAPDIRSHTSGRNAASEDAIDKVGAPGTTAARVDTNRVVCQVKAQLISIASTVDRVSEPSAPTVELLEASRAIQTAPVSERSEKCLRGLSAGCRR
jgi:hypothetical protein